MEQEAADALRKAEFNAAEALRLKLLQEVENARLRIIENSVMEEPTLGHNRMPASGYLFSEMN